MLDPPNSSLPNSLNGTHNSHNGDSSDEDEQGQGIEDMSVPALSLSTAEVEAALNSTSTTTTDEQKCLVQSQTRAQNSFSITDIVSNLRRESSKPISVDENTNEVLAQGDGDTENENENDIVSEVEQSMMSMSMALLNYSKIEPQLNEFKQAIATRDNIIKRVVDSYRVLELELEEKNEAIKKFEAMAGEDDETICQVQDLTRKLEYNQKYLDEQAVEREMERDEFSRKVAQVETKIEELMKEKVHFEKVIDNQKLEIDDLEVRLKETTESEQDLLSKADRVEDELKMSVEKIYELREIIRDLEEQIDSATHNACQLKEQNEYLSDEVERLELERKEREQESNVINLDTTCGTLVSDVNDDLLVQVQDLAVRLVKKLNELDNFPWGTRPNSSCSGALSVSTEEISVRELSYMNKEKESTPLQVAEGLRQLEIHFESLVRFEEVMIKRLKDTELRLSHTKKREEELESEKPAYLEAMKAQTIKISDLESRLDQFRFQPSPNTVTLSGLRSRVANLSEEVEEYKGQIQLRNLEMKELLNKLEASQALLSMHTSSPKRTSPVVRKISSTTQTDQFGIIRQSNCSVQTDRDRSVTKHTCEKSAQTISAPKNTQSSRKDWNYPNIALDSLELSTINGGPPPAHSTPNDVHELRTSLRAQNYENSSWAERMAQIRKEGQGSPEHLREPRGDSNVHYNSRLDQLSGRSVPSTSDKEEPDDGFLNVVEITSDEAINHPAGNAPQFRVADELRRGPQSSPNSVTANAQRSSSVVQARSAKEINRPQSAPPARNAEEVTRPKSVLQLQGGNAEEVGRTGTASRAAIAREEGNTGSAPQTGNGEEVGRTGGSPQTGRDEDTKRSHIALSTAEEEPDDGYRNVAEITSDEANNHPGNASQSRDADEVRPGPQNSSNSTSPNAQRSSSVVQARSAKEVDRQQSVLTSRNAEEVSRPQSALQLQDGNAEEVGRTGTSSRASITGSAPQTGNGEEVVRTDSVPQTGNPEDTKGSRIALSTDEEEPDDGFRNVVEITNDEAINRSEHASQFRVADEGPQNSANSSIAIAQRSSSIVQARSTKEVNRQQSVLSTRNAEEVSRPQSERQLQGGNAEEVRRTGTSSRASIAEEVGNTGSAPQTGNGEEVGRTDGAPQTGNGEEVWRTDSAPQTGNADDTKVSETTLGTAQAQRRSDDPASFNAGATNQSQGHFQKPGSEQGPSFEQMGQQQQSMNLQQQLASMANELQDLRGQLRCFEEAYNNMQRMYEIEKANVGIMCPAILTLRNEQQENKRIIETLECQLVGRMKNEERLSMQINELASRLDEQQKSRDGLVAENQELKRQIYHLQTQIRSIHNTAMVGGPSASGGPGPQGVSRTFEMLLRVKSFRKALTWQKNYLMIVIHEYKDLLRENASGYEHPDLLQKEIPMTPTSVGAVNKRLLSTRFRIAGRVVIATIRMKWMVHRWINRMAAGPVSSSNSNENSPPIPGSLTSLSPPTREKESRIVSISHGFNRLDNDRGRDDVPYRRPNPPRKTRNYTPPRTEIPTKDSAVLSQYIERFQYLEGQIGRSLRNSK